MNKHAIQFTFEFTKTVVSNTRWDCAARMECTLESRSNNMVNALSNMICQSLVAKNQNSISKINFNAKHIQIIKINKRLMYPFLFV